MLDPFVASFVDSMFKTSKDILRKGDEVMPQVWFIARKKETPALLPVLGIADLFQSKESKRLLRPLVKATWAQIAADKPVFKLIAVLLCSDSWVESPTEEQYNKMFDERGRRLVPFAPKVGMSEALLVQISFEEQEVTYSWPYVRGGGHIVFANEPMKMKSRKEDYSKRVLMGLWPL